MIDKLFIRLWPKSKYGLILLVIFSLALFLRIYPRLGDVFGSGWVRFGEVDPWYHIRLLENLLQHFPHQITFDPYSFFPNGQPVEFAPFFDLMLGSIIWIIGLGSPTLHTVEVTAAYFPAILGALTVIPVYFIGKELFNKTVGLISAVLIAILPGTFLARSLLGVTDHHVAETLLSTVAALFLILAIKNARGKIKFRDIGNRDWGKIKKPLIYALLCGLFLGMYVTTWVGSLLFILIIFVYFVIQFIIDHLMGESSAYLSFIGVPIFLVALMLVIPFLGQGGLTAMYPTSLGFGVASFTALAGLSWLMENKHVKRTHFLLTSTGIILAAIGIVYALAPRLFISMISHFNIFWPQGGSTTITEVQPLFFGFESLTQNRAWGFFTTGFFIAPISFILLGYSSVKKFKAENLFLIIWSALMVAAMLGQSRFSYYFAVNVALLGSYFCWRIFGWVSRILNLLGFSDRQPLSSEYTGKKKKGTAAKTRKTSRPYRYLKVVYASAGLSAILGFLLVFYPNISPAIAVANIDTGPNDDWHESLLWMKDNTPDPFLNPNYFNGLYTAPPAGQPFNYPKSAYGVMSAWEYGHWITTIAHRIPNSNPHQFGAVDSALFFTAQDESRANQILERLGSKYVIINIDMATSTFLNNAAWIKESDTAFRETYYQANAQGILEPLTVYYPEYYQSMSSRLYNFGGESVVPQNSTGVISYEDRMDSKGTHYKRITSSKLFLSFEEAEAYHQKTPNSRIVGTDPFISPVPLDKLEHYQLVHASNTVIEQNKDLKLSYVEIFEYRP